MLSETYLSKTRYKAAKKSNNDLLTLQQKTSEILEAMGVEGRGLFYYEKHARWQVDFIFKGIRGQVTLKGAKSHDTEKTAHIKFQDKAEQVMQ